MGTLRLGLGTSPLRTEHERLLRTALRRGSEDDLPEIPETLRLEGISPEARAISIETWRARALHEHQSSCVFSRLLPQLIEAEASIEYKTVVLRAAMDEIRHAALCMQVVSYLGGEPVLEAPLATEVLPEHNSRTPRERALRNVIFASCMSETISTSLLAEERELTTEPRIQRIVEQLSADEILHAKLGWALLEEWLPKLTEDERDGLARYLPLAFGVIEAKMLNAMPVGAPFPEPLRTELRGLGAMEGSDGREILYAVLESVIAPRFDELGLPGTRAWNERKTS
jgi:hypothetical protein